MTTLTRWERHSLGGIRDWLDGPLMVLRLGGAHPMRLEICRTDREFIVRTELPGVYPEKTSR